MSHRKKHHHSSHNYMRYSSYKKVSWKRYIPWFVIIAFFIGLIAYSQGISIPFIKTCEDGTWNGYCSSDKPFYCSGETLIENVSKCGCAYDYEPVGDICEKIPTCTGGIFYGECSPNKPYYCDNGVLIQKASSCGCPSRDVREGEKCISKYETNSKIVKLPEIGDFQVYGGLNDYLAGLSNSISYYTNPPTNKDFILKDIDNSIQRRYLNSIVDEIRLKSNNSQEQAIIAIQLVQKIPYDYDGLYGTPDGRAPYEVIYDMKGVCGEKSLLLIYLLRGLGFGVASFEFDLEGHRAVGVKCDNCDYAESGYCFIESTSPTIPTDSEGDYIGAGKLGLPSEIITITDGMSLDLSRECDDAKEWNGILGKGEILSSYDYNRWSKLVKEYGMEISD